MDKIAASAAQLTNRILLCCSSQLCEHKQKLYSLFNELA